MAGQVHNIYSELEQRLNKTITQRFPELTFANGVDVPTVPTLAPGAESVSVDEISGYGQAGLLGAESSDIPLVQISVGKGISPVVMAVAGYSVGFKADRAYSFSGKSQLVTDRSVLMVRRAIDERLHYFAAYGDAGLGVRGLYNNAAVAPVASAFDPNTADYAAYLTFFMDLILNMGLTTTNLSIPTDILIPRKMLLRMSKLVKPTGISMGILATIQGDLAAMDGYSNIRIVTRPESESDNITAKAVIGVPANKDRVVVYRKDPMVLERQVENRLAQLMPSKYIFADPKGAINYPMFGCASATQIYETNSISYIDVNKAT
jgi:hypothetical protein